MFRSRREVLAEAGMMAVSLSFGCVGGGQNGGGSTNGFSASGGVTSPGGDVKLNIVVPEFDTDKIISLRNVPPSWINPPVGAGCAETNCGYQEAPNRIHEESITIKPMRGRSESSTELLIGLNVPDSAPTGDTNIKIEYAEEGSGDWEWEEYSRLRSNGELGSEMVLATETVTVTVQD